MNSEENGIGTTVSISRKITERDVDIFGGLSLDRNSIHFDDTFAAKSIFKKRIAHGLLGGAIISGALTKLMGEGNIWLSLSIKFEKPIYMNDYLTCILTIKEINKRRIATVDVKILNEKEEIVISGDVQAMRFLK